MPGSVLLLSRRVRRRHCDAAQADTARVLHDLHVPTYRTCRAISCRTVKRSAMLCAEAYIAMADIPMAYRVMAYRGMAYLSYGPHSYGMYSYGPHSHGLYITANRCVVLCVPCMRVYMCVCHAHVRARIARTPHPQIRVQAYVDMYGDTCVACQRACRHGYRRT